MEYELRCLLTLILFNLNIDYMLTSENQKIFIRLVEIDLPLKTKDNENSYIK